jgi:hypothetical protein
MLEKNKIQRKTNCEGKNEIYCISKKVIFLESLKSIDHSTYMCWSCQGILVGWNLHDGPKIQITWILLAQLILLPNYVQMA